MDRRKLLERVREAFKKDFEFIDVRHVLTNSLLTDEECRQIMCDEEPEKQLDRLFFLLAYDEKKSIAQFIDLIRSTYSWLSEDMVNYVQHPREEGLEVFEACINRSWIPNKRNALVHRCALVSLHLKQVETCIIVVTIHRKITEMLS